MTTRPEELGRFLRMLRERAAPPGMASARRRRTPGLRREELATLCGISVTWYTWIEQGRAPGLSGYPGAARRCTGRDRC
ncbi:helix-turn-helix transcriptional regulator [Acidiferrobacter sp. SPIII_3]|uniref:helix-turn-helix domain-containing protein n=1 Tax=Acidiferrobacter sp. SPIII_3 TaxID=1281578 RepID=UPI00197AF82C